MPAQPQADGRVAGAPADYAADIELTVRDDDGSEKTAMVTAHVRAVNRNGKIEYVPEENGPLVEYHVPGEKDPRRERPDTLNDKVVSHVAPQQTEAAPVQEASTETPATAETTPAPAQQQPEAAPQPVQEPVQTVEPQPAQPAEVPARPT